MTAVALPCAGCGHLLYPKQEPSKESKTMQEVRVEIERRLATLERQTEHCKTEREQHIAEVAKIDQQIRENETLTKQYQQVLKSLTVSLTYVSS